VRALFIFIATTAVMVVFQLTTVAGGLPSHAWAVPWLWGFWALAWIAWSANFQIPRLWRRYRRHRRWQRQISDLDHPL
jgi:hypothetical protein